MRPTAIHPALVRGGLGRELPTGVDVIRLDQWRDWKLNPRSRQYRKSAKYFGSSCSNTDARYMDATLQEEARYRQEFQQRLAECFRAAPGFQQPGAAEAEVQRLLQQLPPLLPAGQEATEPAAPPAAAGASAVAAAAAGAVAITAPAVEGPAPAEHAFEAADRLLAAAAADADADVDKDAYADSHAHAAADAEQLPT